jgi:uncharacterized membrane protein YkvA (DUF1232 family)
MREAQEKMRGRDEKLILAGARHLARQTQGLTLPDFVGERLRELDTLTRMLEDPDWQLEGAHRKRVVEALAYFADPSDLVPDQIPGLGLLDDAIMVELVAQELRPELDAYALFCAYRENSVRWTARIPLRCTTASRASPSHTHASRPARRARAPR